MQIKPEQLADKLGNQSPPIVWISGDEALLVQEACDTVRRHARQSGFSEREVLEAGSGFDWRRLLQSAGNLSLFGEKKLIDLRLPSAKMDAAGREALVAYAGAASPDNLLLITSPRVEKASTSTKWFKALTERALFVQVWPIGLQQLPQWIARRLRAHGLEADAQALRLLAERVEGNLLAAAQEVEKLGLLAGGGRVDVATVKMAVADSSRFNVFSLLEAALAGDAARALKILYHLEAEAAEVLQLLNLLCRELRQLILMKRKIEGGSPAGAVMQAERVWNARVPLVGAALDRHPSRALEAMLRDALVVDQAVKGMKPNDPWDELAGLLLRLAGHPLPLSA